MNARARSALAELAASNPVPHESYPTLAHQLDWILYRLPDQEPRLPKSKTTLWLAGAAAAVLVVAAGAALAATSWGPLAGIGTADHPTAARDALPSSVLAQLKSDEQPAGSGVDPIGVRLVDQARFLGSIPGANSVYVVPTTKGKLCVLVASESETCVDALTRTRPATLTIQTPSPDKPTIVWGVTTDGVETISFSANGSPVTTQVRNNFYAWQSPSNSGPVRITDATAHFAGGSSIALR